MIYTEEQIQGYLDLIKRKGDIELGYGYGYIGPSGGGGPIDFNKELDLEELKNKSYVIAEDNQDSQEPEVENTDEDLAEIFRELEEDFYVPLEGQQYPTQCCGVS